MRPIDRRNPKNRVPASRPLVGTRRAGWRLALPLLAGVSLAACGGEIELNGTLFDMAGISPSALAAAKREPKLEPRQGLVVPPTASLPQPGSAEEPPAIDTASWPRDPDQIKSANAARAKVTLAAYCKDKDWFEKSRPREFAEVTQDGLLCLGPIGKAANAPIDKPVRPTEAAAPPPPKPTPAQ